MELSFSSINSKRVYVFPNPVFLNQKLTLFFERPLSGNVLIMLWQPGSTFVLQRKYYFNRPIDKQVLHLKNVACGMYFLRLEYGGKTALQKLLILK